MCIYIIAYYHPSKIKCNKKCAIISKIIAQNICFKYQKQGIVDVLLELNKALTGQRCGAGTCQTVTLIARMDAAGEGDQVARLQDPEFVQEMLKKYDL